MKLADDPVKASAALNEQYHYLTASVYSQIAALEEPGDHAGAVKLATESYADAINERTPKILEKLSFWEKAYNAVAQAADGLKSAGRRDINSDIENARAGLAEAQGMDGLFQSQKSKDALIEFRQNRLNMLEDEKAAQADIAKWKGEQAKAQGAAVTAMTKVDALTKSSLTNEQKRTKEIEDYKQQLADIRKVAPNDPRLQQDVVDKNISNINAKFKDPKAAGTQVDLTAFNDAKNELAAITDTYKNYQKELEAAQKAGLLSEEDYLLRRQALIGNQLDQTKAAYEAEISALEAAKGKKSTSAGGNGLAAGSAGATSSNLGASSAGYSNTYFPQAKGGAWSGGVQMFADGGAFTNSIVSNPTAFGMANGKTGVMGEAGEEAIMPLTRTSSGKLGVMAAGGGSGSTQINVEVHIDGEGNASSSADAPGYDLFGKELAAFVEQKYQQMRNKDIGQGGVINKAIKGR